MKPDAPWDFILPPPVSAILRDGSGLKQKIENLSLALPLVSAILRDGSGLKLIKCFVCRSIAQVSAILRDGSGLKHEKNLRKKA